MPDMVITTVAIVITIVLMIVVMFIAIAGLLRSIRTSSPRGDDALLSRSRLVSLGLLGFEAGKPGAIHET